MTFYLYLINEVISRVYDIILWPQAKLRFLEIYVYSSSKRLSSQINPSKMYSWVTNTKTEQCVPNLVQVSDSSVGRKLPMESRKISNQARTHSPVKSQVPLCD